MERQTVQCSYCLYIFEYQLKSKTLTQVVTCPKCANKFTFDPTKPKEIARKDIIPKIKNFSCPGCGKSFNVKIPNIQAKQIFTTCPSCELKFEITKEISIPKEKLQKPMEITKESIEFEKEVPKSEEVKKEEKKEIEEEIEWHEEIKQKKKIHLQRKLKEKPKQHLKIKKKIGKTIEYIKNFDICQQLSNLKKYFISKNFQTKVGFAGLLLLLVFIIGIIYGIFWITENLGTESFKESSQKIGTVEGKVEDKNGEAINDAHILFIGKNNKFEATTNQEGWYIIEDIYEGYYNVIAEKENYGSLTIKNVKVLPGQIETVDFVLGSKDKTIILEKDDELKKNSMKGIIIFFTSSIFALLGSFLAIQKKSFKACSLFTVLSIPSFGFLIGSILAIIALILILSSKEDFK